MEKVQEIPKELYKLHDQIPLIQPTDMKTGYHTIYKRVPHFLRKNNEQDLSTKERQIRSTF